jgi:hypothetical protein
MEPELAFDTKVGWFQTFCAFLLEDIGKAV